ncbi:hypothetical protein CMI37_30905 [Candidatus Pacearchaeota archaeon]|nr:hypothetical protein [Candidatus Pacearchaeota archaeon]
MAKTKLTPIKKERDKTKLLKKTFIERFFKASGNISLICNEVKITRAAYYKWMQKDPVFKNEIEHQIEGLFDFVEHKLFNLIDEKNVAAVIFFLKTKAKNRGYYEKSEIIGSMKSELNLDQSTLLQIAKMIKKNKDKNATSAASKPNSKT